MDGDGIRGSMVVCGGGKGGELGGGGSDGRVIGRGDMRGGGGIVEGGESEQK